MQSLWEMMALLARWFRFQPSEMDGMELEDVCKWCELALDQIKRERGDG